MLWTTLWFENQMRLWEERKTLATVSMSHGHQVYAAKQVWVWRTFLDDAKKAFQKILPQEKL
jgi:hypothetical protein